MTSGDRQGPSPGELASLFHRLNNQLGIILANAELLELKSGDEAIRARAGLVVSSTIEAMATARDLRSRVEGTVSGGDETSTK
jgi:hypothetical protein